MGSQADFVSKLLEADVAILLGSVWLVAQLVSLQSSLVCGAVATHITLEGMLAGVDLCIIGLKQYSEYIEYIALLPDLISLTSMSWTVSNIVWQIALFCGSSSLLAWYSGFNKIHSGSILWM